MGSRIRDTQKGHAKAINSGRRRTHGHTLPGDIFPLQEDADYIAKFANDDPNIYLQA
jgi:hypothetical protein